MASKMKHLTVRGQANVHHGLHIDVLSIVAGDSDRPLVLLGLTPETMQFFLSYLPEDDGFTQDLALLAEEMKQLLWERVS